MNRGNFPFTRALTTSYPTNGYPALIPTTTIPSGAGVFFPGGQPASTYVLGHENLPSSLSTPYSIAACFFGAGAENATFSSRLIGWKQTRGIDALSLWIPVPLLQVQCTLGTTVGVASADADATDRFADTITLAAAYGVTDQNGVLVTSTTGDLVAHLVASIHGFGAFQWIFDTGGSATNANCFFCHW